MSTDSLEDHPAWRAIEGFKLKDRVQSRLAFKVYMDLTEVKGWWNMKVHLCEELQLVFLSGHASRTKAREIILPLSTEARCSPAQLQTYLRSIRLQEYNTDQLILALSSPDSNTAYYKVTDGLVPPEPPEVTEWKKYRYEELPQLRRHHVGEQTAAYIRDHTPQDKALESAMPLHDEGHESAQTPQDMALESAMPPQDVGQESAQIPHDTAQD